jgi:hypothetical protein
MPTFLNTSRFSLRKPGANQKINDFTAIVDALADDVDSNILGYATGVLAGRGAAGHAGRVYFATDTSQWSIDNGSTWQPFVTGITDAQITHGAWTTVTPASGFSGTTGNYSPQARVEGDRVYLRGALQNISGGVITVGSNVFGLPAGMAPAKNVVLSAPRSDGAISVLGISGGSTTCSILGSAVSIGVNLDFDDQFFPLTV